MNAKDKASDAVTTKVDYATYIVGVSSILIVTDSALDYDTRFSLRGCDPIAHPPSAGAIEMGLREDFS